MLQSITFTLSNVVLALVYAIPNYDNEDQCLRINCFGQEYQCVNGVCRCADGYIPSPFGTRCVRCPGFGDQCISTCCGRFENLTLTCWQGVCQACRDYMNNWACRDSLDNILLISSTQIAMATALILGIIATFVLLFKLCAVTNLRPLGNRSNASESRLSIGSLQVYVEERLRDAPPRYSRTAPSGSAVMPATVYVNAGFIHDSSIPPPPYTPQKEEENQQNATVHI